LEVNYPDIIIGVETKRLYDDGEVEEEVVTSADTSTEDDETINEEEVSND